MSAKVFLNLLDKDMRLINVDETWFSSTDFRRMKWAVSGGANSVAKRTMGVRICFIAALDTDGRIYGSLTQVNTDHDVFRLFVAQLAAKLRAEDPDWTSNTTIVWDGASYHKHGMIRQLVRQLGVQVVMNGPYGYDGLRCSDTPLMMSARYSPIIG